MNDRRHIAMGREIRREEPSEVEEKGDHHCLLLCLADGGDEEADAEDSEEVELTARKRRGRLPRIGTLNQKEATVRMAITLKKAMREKGTVFRE